MSDYGKFGTNVPLSFLGFVGSLVLSVLVLYLTDAELTVYSLIGGFGAPAAYLLGLFIGIEEASAEWEDEE